MADRVPRLQEQYQDEVRANLVDQFGYENDMEVPRLNKVVINRGVGEVSENEQAIDTAVEELRKITGQHPTVNRASKSIASFDVREGMPIGASVTLRDEHMFEFLDRLITLALPNIRDFEGVPDRSFDGHGNYTLGIDEQIIFPEIDVDNVDRIDGMDVTFVTSAETDEEAYALLEGLGMPFVRREEEDDEPAPAV
ncbi:MAG: 50S ribosomal protein L5 [Bacteroidetes bacterium QH_7_62_13]|nr:MAG: 50S ribosomal protein L5 [Bacteroidetes bacterium QH_7_62_13]